MTHTIFLKKIKISSDGHSNRRTLTYKTKFITVEFEIYSQTSQTFGLEDVNFLQLRSCLQNEVLLRNIPCNDIYGQSISINARLNVSPFFKGNPESKEQQKWANLLLQTIEDQFCWDKVKREL